MPSPIDRRVSRRQMLRLATVTAGALAVPALSACVATVTPAAPAAEVAEATPTTAPAEAAPQSVTLRWWSYYTAQDRCLTCGSIAKEFEDNNPGIKVEMSHGAADYSTKLATAFAGGDPPELAGTTHTTMLLEVSDKAILPLDDWYVQSGTKERMHPAALQWCSAEGQLWTVSGWDLFCQEWYYNKAAFDQAGVKEPTTKDELYQVCDGLKDVVKFPFLFAGMSTWLWPEFLSLIQAQTTGIALIEKGTEAKDYHIPELKEAIELFGEMWKAIVPDASLGIEANDSITTFANGEVGIISYHTAWLAGIKASVSQASKVILGSFEKPLLFVDEPKSPWPSGYGSCFVVPKQNKHLDETFALMTHVWSPETQRSLAAAGIGIPPLPEAWDAITDPLYKNAIGHIGESTPEGLFWVDFLHPRVNEAVYTSLLALVNGEGNADGVLDAMTAAIQAV